MSTAVANISADQELVSQELNNQIVAVLNNSLSGFQKAFVMATAIQTLKDKLTPEYMTPIMALQGSKLGFRSDKDLNADKTKGPGYPVAVVKDCLIDAVLLGLQATGNEFNIIGGNMYPTKEGFGSLLKTISGLKYNLTFKNPVTAADGKSANVEVIVDWELNGDKNSQTIDFPMKSNAYATSDALIGKATRKARGWLYNYISGTDIADGDVQEPLIIDITPKTGGPIEVSDAKQSARVIKHIDGSKSLEELEKCKSAIKSTDNDLIEKYETKASELLVDFIEKAILKDELLTVQNKIPAGNLDLQIQFDDKLAELSKS